jgi:hypothetical protein
MLFCAGFEQVVKRCGSNEKVHSVRHTDRQNVELQHQIMGTPTGIAGIVSARFTGTINRAHFVSNRKRRWQQSTHTGVHLHKTPLITP